MADSTDDVLDVDLSLIGDEQMAVDESNLQVALTAMADEFGAAAARRNNSADQLAGDSQRMWSIAMTSPTIMAAHGMRIASEAGAGRSRSETNNPSNTAAP